MTAFLMAVSMNSQIIENFDDITLLNDWDFVNVSEFVGTSTWFQGNDGVFPSHQGDPTSYIGVNFNSTAGSSTISNWMILPTTTLSDGDEIIFFTRTGDGSAFPDRLEVRLSTDGDGSVAPTDFEDEGSYTILLESINPDLEVGGYPEEWTQYTITLSGIGNAVDTRVAFRYFVTNGGPSGVNSNYIGIDTLEIIQNLSIADNDIDGFNYFYNRQNQTLTINANEVFSSINIFNVLGQEVINKNLSSSSEVINLSSLKTGVYIANANVNGKIATFKLVKR